MAAVDAGYRFIVVDVGNYGSNSDTGIFKHSHFGQKFLLNELGLPPRKPLPGFPQAGLLPHCFVGDEAFPCLWTSCDLTPEDREEQNWQRTNLSLIID